MTSTAPNRPSSIRYSPATIERAELAVRCAPFQLQLFTQMRWQSVDLKSIAGQQGVQNHYTRRPIAELAAEDALLWLIQVGLLRREVDGQGLTDSFRLTPLGHQLVEEWQTEETLPALRSGDRLRNFVNRWMRLPSWLP